MKSTRRKAVAVQPFFGGFILETLTLGMYSESRNAIREYIQNAFDAILAARDEEVLGSREGLVTITLTDGRMTIRDNGVGMSEDLAVTNLTSIGHSVKDHRKQAGFRGIGRLAGLVMCDELTFRTKAAGDINQTEVVFDAKGLRKAMAPDGKAKDASLEQLLSEYVTATQEEAEDQHEHFFEVDLNRLRDAPAECSDADALETFLSQVAPVAYRDDFPFRAQLHTEGRRRRAVNEVIQIDIIDNEGTIRPVRKPYGEEFLIGKTLEPLKDVEIIGSESGYFWGWVSVKDVPAAFNGPEAGIRLRMRNIQLDGKEFARDLFGSVEDAKSYARLSDWYIGEIFLDPVKLVPNARRDGVEDTPAWFEARKELVGICQRLGKDAYALSAGSAMTIEKIALAIKDLQEQQKRLPASLEGNLDTLVKFANEVSKVQRKIQRAMKAASEADVLAQLRRAETTVIKIRDKADARTGSLDAVEAVRTKLLIQREMLSQIRKHFIKRLDAQCRSKALLALRELYGDELMESS